MATAPVSVAARALKREYAKLSRQGYFGDAYGLQFIAPEGLSTDVEPSARDVAAIIAAMRRSIGDWSAARSDCGLHP